MTPQHIPYRARTELPGSNGNRRTKEANRYVRIEKILAPTMTIPGLNEKLSNGKKGDGISLGDARLKDDSGEQVVMLLPLSMLSLYNEEDEVRTYGDLPHTSKLPKTTNDVRPSTSLAGNISQIDGDEQILHHGECDDDLSSAGSCVDILDEDVGSRRLDSIPISATRVLENLSTQRQSASTAKLDPAPAHIRDIFSSILGDLFHYMHRPKTPKDHEMNKTYFRHLADAFLIWDKGKMNEVRQTLRKHGFSDKDIDLKLFYEPDFFRECVPRVAPPEENGM